MPGATAAKYGDPVFFGGPVMRSAIVALYRSETPPPAAAFPVMKHLYLTLHPANIAGLLEGTGQRFRLYAGFAGWAPLQLESELEREGWYVLPVREELLFRKDTAGMWKELVDRAGAARALHRHGASIADVTIHGSEK
jgi:putative transcriptional regulator